MLQIGRCLRCLCDIVLLRDLAEELSADMHVHGCTIEQKEDKWNENKSFRMQFYHKRQRGERIKCREDVGERQIVTKAGKIIVAHNTYWDNRSS